jgi:hypothetical protein
LLFQFLLELCKLLHRNLLFFVHYLADTFHLLDLLSRQSAVSCKRRTVGEKLT